jgi:hypothetical protein
MNYPLSKDEELIALRIQVAFLRSREDDYLTMTANALVLVEKTEAELREAHVEIAALRSILALSAGMETAHA